MIESPKNFIEQFQNFIEHIAGVMKTFLTKEVADNYYLGKTAKAVSAGTADTAGSATKATQDANGNVIPDTYATKSELTSGLATKQPVGDYPTKSELDNTYLGIDDTAALADGLTQKAVDKLYVEQSSVEVAETQRYECTMHGTFNLRKRFSHRAVNYEREGSCTVGLFRNEEQILTKTYTWSDINGGGHSTQTELKGTDYFFNKGDIVTIKLLSGVTSNSTASFMGTFTGNWIEISS